VALILTIGRAVRQRPGRDSVVTPWSQTRRHWMTPDVTTTAVRARNLYRTTRHGQDDTRPHGRILTGGQEVGSSNLPSPTKGAGQRPPFLPRARCLLKANFQAVITKVFVRLSEPRRRASCGPTDELIHRTSQTMHSACLGLPAYRPIVGVATSAAPPRLEILLLPSRAPKAALPPRPVPAERNLPGPPAAGGAAASARLRVRRRSRNRS
jgi:hypothetical protein